MARLPRGSMTRIGFRRDVKLFLTALVGYLIVVILSLLLILQNAVITTQELSRKTWETVADSMVRDIGALEDISGVKSRLSFYNVDFDILSATLTTPTGVIIQSGFPFADEGHVIERATLHGRLAVVFDDTIIRHEMKKFKWIAIISILGSLGVTALLVFYIPQIVRPIEELMIHASEIEEKASGVDEAHYLVETFKLSVDTLKQQKEELSRLHESEKSRADDLERVTATLKRSITSGFLAVDPDRRLVEINDPGRDVLGIERSIEVTGGVLRDILPDSRFASDLDECLSSRRSLTRHETTHTRGKSEFTIGLTTVPLFDEHTNYLGMIAIFTDLTPIRGLEARVRELQTLADLGEIAAGIAHEFRNSLGTILGYLRLAVKNDEASPSRIEAAEREARLLSEAVNKLLRFSRPIELDRRVVDLTELARDVVDKLAPEAEGVAMSVVGDTAEVSGDGSLLRVVIENLVRNALDAVRKLEGERLVSVETTAGHHTRLAVVDNGPGLPRDEVPRVFLPFQSAKPGGFGLGLALAKKIVLMHEGQIGLEPSESGMTAWIELPGIE